MKKIHGIVLTGAVALVLAACGSSDSGSATPVPPVATSEVPASATQDSAGLSAYINQLIGASSDTGEPIVVGDAVLPVDDTTDTSL